MANLICPGASFKDRKVYEIRKELHEHLLDQPSSGAPRNIYLASSWRNPIFFDVLGDLRGDGHRVYNFRAPLPSNYGFSWDQIDPKWRSWTAAQYLEALRTPRAQEGFELDKAGLDWCDTCVLLLPSGRSAHIEAGYAAGAGKQLITLLPDPPELEQPLVPDLMYLLGTAIVSTRDQLRRILRP